MIIHLHLTGDISKYINMKYAYLSKSAAIMLAILTIVQIYQALKQDHENHDEHCGCSHQHDVHCGCEHHHGTNDKKWKRILVSGIFIYPVITGIFFPVATLDSTTVMAKGFHFPATDPGTTDPYGQRQFLKPDTSLYYGKAGYTEIMEKQKDEFLGDSITLNDENFLKGMESIYYSPGEFEGKELTFDGFVFNDEELNTGQMFIFRFGIIHCVADSGVFGMLVDMPEGVELEDDTWIRVTGTLGRTYYQPFKSTIPTLHVTEWNNIPEPEEEYVFRGYDN